MTQDLTQDHTTPQAIAAVIRRDDGRYLLIKRGPDLSAAGYWTTVTGKPEAGETLADTVRREAAEEVGLSITAGRELYRCYSHNQAWLIIWFETTLDDPTAAYQPLRVDTHEVADTRWVTAEQAAALSPMFDDTRRFFAKPME